MPAGSISTYRMRRFADFFAHADAIGYSAFKIKVGHPDFEWDLNRLNILQKTVRKGAQFMIDTNEGWGAKEALNKLGVIRHAGYDLLWSEDPILRDDLPGLKMLCDEVSWTMINSGEYLDARGKRLLMEADAVDILNVHGQITDVMRIGWLAAEIGIPMSLGNTFLEVGVHLACALPEVEWLEYSFQNFDHLVEEPMLIKDGYIYAPDRPGHGLAVSETARRDWSRPTLISHDALGAAPANPRTSPPQNLTAIRVIKGRNSMIFNSTRIRGGAHRHCSPPAPLSPAGATGQITVWADATRQPAVEAFEKAHPEIKVNLVLDDGSSGASGTLQTKIALADQAGSGWPDVVFSSQVNDAAWASNETNGVQAFAMALNKGFLDQPFLDGFTPGALDPVTVDGTVYGLRNDLAPVLFWYNKALLEKFGYDVPKTWEDYQALGDKLAKDHPGYFLGAVGDSFEGPYIYYWSGEAPIFQVKDNTFSSDVTAANIDQGHRPPRPHAEERLADAGQRVRLVVRRQGRPSRRNSRPGLVRRRAVPEPGEHQCQARPMGCRRAALLVERRQGHRQCRRRRLVRFEPHDQPGCGQNLPRNSSSPIRRRPAPGGYRPIRMPPTSGLRRRPRVASMPATSRQRFRRRPAPCGTAGVTPISPPRRRGRRLSSQASPAARPSPIWRPTGRRR